MKKEKTTWFYVAIVFLAVSLISLFLPIINYRDVDSKMYYYSITDFISSDDFVHRVLYHYNGPVWWDIGELTVMLLTVAAILALLCAVIGLFTLRQQRPNTWQFILTIVGLVGTGLPSILVITAVFLSDKYFDGDVTCGICPVIMPLSMIICIFAVLRRKNHVTEQLRREALAKGLIRKAGDL